MKKLTVFFVLLLCVSFAEVSAQTVRWEVTGNTWLKISVNGVVMVDSRSNSWGTSCPPAYGPQSGTFSAAAGDQVVIIASNTSGNTSAVIEPLITEDDPYMIENAQYTDYNFTNEEHTAIYEYFFMPDGVPMYVGVNS